MLIIEERNVQRKLGNDVLGVDDVLEDSLSPR